MKKRILAVACCTFAICAITMAEEENNRPTRIRIRALESELKNVEREADDTWRATTVRRLVQSNEKTVEEISKALKDAGLKGERLEKLSSEIEKLLKEHGGKSAFGFGYEIEDSPIKVERKAIVIDRNGERREIKLLEPQKVEQNQPRVVRRFPADQKQLWEQMQKHLKAAGLNEEQIKKLQLSLEDGRNDAAIGIFLGPDGQLRKYAFDALRDRPEVTLTLADPSGKFLIGLDCVPASEVLRAQLKLGESALVVDQVFEDTPAKKAGVQRLDVLTKANDNELSTIEDLIAAVQEAGKTEKELKLTVIREGKKRSIDVTPAERKVVGFERRLLDLRDVEQPDTAYFYKLLGPSKVGPGVSRVEPAPHVDVQSLKKEVEQLRQQLEKLQKEFKKSQDSN